MSCEERRKILHMVADGKISAEEAATLLRAMEESAEGAVGDDSASAEPEVFMPGPSWGGERSEAPESDEVRRRARRFSGAFLWIGIIMTVFISWWMFGIQ